MNPDIVNSSMNPTPSTPDISSLIYCIRNQQVMLSHNLAKLYNVETKRLNESVKRNNKRFPENFCFQLTEEEWSNLPSNTSVSIESGKVGGRRYLPYAFTEQGIAMLSAVLHSDKAIEVSIQIMNAFVSMRHFLMNNAVLFERINEIDLKQMEFQKVSEEKFNQIFSYISDHAEPTQKVFFDGQIYDAFALISRLIQKAASEIILIDGYIGSETLDFLSKKKKNVPAIIYTYQRSYSIPKTEINAFNKQYPSLQVRYMNHFHDRFLIIDRQYAYHIGASLKDAGKKCFAITLLSDKQIISDILNRL